MKHLLFVLLVIYLPWVFSERAHTYYFILKWFWVRTEKAFNILLSKIREFKGGIFRIDPNSGGGAANALGTKLEFMIKNNTHEIVSVRWHPDLFYCNTRYSPASQMGFPPIFSVYKTHLVKLI